MTPKDQEQRRGNVVEMPAANASHSSSDMADQRGAIKGGLPDLDTPLTVRDDLVKHGIIERPTKPLTKGAVLAMLKVRIQADHGYDRNHAKDVAAPIVGLLMQLYASKPTVKELNELATFEDEPIIATKSVVEATGAAFKDGESIEERTEDVVKASYKQRFQRYRRLAQLSLGEVRKGELLPDTVNIMGVTCASPFEHLLSGRFPMTSVLAAWNAAVKPLQANMTELAKADKRGIIRSAAEAAPKWNFVVRELREETVAGRDAKIHRRKSYKVIQNSNALFGAIQGLIKAARTSAKGAIELSPEHKAAIVDLLSPEEEDAGTTERATDRAAS